MKVINFSNFVYTISTSRILVPTDSLSISWHVRFEISPLLIFVLAYACY
uniref:Uncharacterized protein n=1 Tax=Parascaris equorum TaxID=6256 RepID=A0A914R9Z0_PAREQ